MRPFPNVDDDRVQVSNAGGLKPVWSRDSGELFYVEAGEPDRMMAVVYEATETEFSVVSRTPLLDWPYLGINGPAGRSYDVSHDGQRFLAIKPSGDAGAAERIIIVQNWFEEVMRLVPTE